MVEIMHAMLEQEVQEVRQRARQAIQPGLVRGVDKHVTFLSMLQNTIDYCKY